MRRRPPRSTRTTLSLHDARPILPLRPASAPDGSSRTTPVSIAGENGHARPPVRQASGRAPPPAPLPPKGRRECQAGRSEEHTSELQSLMRISYAVFCLKKKNNRITQRLITS